MISRCLRQNHPNYAKYGAKGISICDQWMSFEGFYNDMGEPPTSRHTLDRINSRGNYEPSNCRWATYIEQGRNRRDNHLVTYNGETCCLAEWAEKLGVKQHTLRARLVKAGLPPEIAFTMPKHQRNRGIV